VTLILAAGFDWVTEAESWVAFVTLLAMEIVLGIQILLLDLVFSLDSVITAVGMVDQISVMILAVIIATIIMIVFAAAIGSFIEPYPTFKMLALSFLVLIGVMLIAEGLHHHIPKGYIYFAMGFSVAVEFLNLRRRRKT
jgi:predicted tellurium resistance membrane protein TerC